MPLYFFYTLCKNVKHGYETQTKGSCLFKGKGNCENEHRETASFMYNFVQETNTTKQGWWHILPTSPLNFFIRFSPEDPFENEL